MEYAHARICSLIRNLGYAVPAAADVDAALLSGGPAEDVVLQVQLGNVLIALPRLPEVLLQNPAGGQPQSPLLLIGVPGSG